MKNLFLTFFLLSTTSLFAHIVQYDVGQKAIYVSVFFDKEHKSSWSKYELYAPEASLPYQQGRSDANGVIAFLPDRAGKWRLDVHAGSDHGEHFKQIELNIDKTMVIKDVTKPLYSKYGAIISGFGLIFGLFGLLYGWINRPKKLKKN
jgi:nickel transport protein